jgi:hypothetical protein
MFLDLPKPIGMYLGSENTDDTDVIPKYFSPDAVVQDEGRTHTGLAAIKAWKTAAKTKTGYTIEPLSAIERDGRTVVSVKVAGKFPNSPITLEYTFAVKHDRIVALDIH